MNPAARDHTSDLPRTAQDPWLDIKRWVKPVLKLIPELLMLFLIVTALLPFWWMVSGGFKPLADLLVFPPRLWPSRWVTDGYELVFNSFPFVWKNFLNSVLVAGLSSIGVIFSTSLGAFAFSRMRFRGKDFIFTLALITLMVPWIVLLIPRFMLFKSLGWIDTLLPLIVPNFFGSAYFLFMLRQYYSTMPAELEEAAMIDGASWPQIYLLISLPIIKPALITMGLFTFMDSWNDLLNPIIYLSGLENMTLTSLMAGMTDAYHSGSMMHAEMAGATITVIPIMIVYFFTQRHIVSSLTFSGLKG
jgi:ABC-type glycerol-3-phosphate transport system permease component